MIGHPVPRPKPKLIKPPPQQRSSKIPKEVNQDEFIRNAVIGLKKSVLQDVDELTICEEEMDNMADEMLNDGYRFLEDKLSCPVPDDDDCKEEVEGWIDEWVSLGNIEKMNERVLRTEGAVKRANEMVDLAKNHKNKILFCSQCLEDGKTSNVKCLSCKTLLHSKRTENIKSMVLIKEESIIKLNSTCKHMNEIVAYQSRNNKDNSPLVKKDKLPG